MPATPALWSAPFQVNTIDTDLAGRNDQQYQSVVRLANGNLLVAWQSNSQTFSPNAGADAGIDVIGQILDPAGNKVGGEIQLNHSWFSDDEGMPSLAALPDGGFAVAFEDNGSATDRSIRVERYGAAGNFVSAASLAADSAPAGTPNHQNPQLAAGSATSAFVAYVTDNGGGDQDVVYRMWNPATNAVGSAVVAFNNAAEAGGGIDSLAVAALSNGNYALVYSDADSATDSDVYVRLYSPAGAFITAKVVLENALRNDDAGVTALQNGGFLVTWIGNVSGSFDVKGRVYDAAGNIVSGELAVNTTVGGDQIAPASAMLQDGSFVIVWSDVPSGSVRGQRFDAAGNKLGTEFTAATGVSADSLAVTVLADGRFAVSWTNDAGGDHDIQMVTLDARDAPNVGGNGDDWVFGTPGADTLFGGVGADKMFGGGGDDTIDVGVGADTIDGGAGRDTVTYSPYSGAVSVDLELGLGFSGAAFGDVFISVENLIGTLANDLLKGDGEDNVLNGIAGDDTLYGGAGNDTLIGQFGTNDMYGGAGADVFDGSNGNSRARYDDTNADIVVSLENPALNTGAAAGDSYVNMLGLFTGGGNDTLTGDALPNYISAGGGNDYVSAGDGGDTLLGGDGNDTLDGGPGNDTFYGGAGDDVFIYTSGDFIIEGGDGQGIDTVVTEANTYLGPNVENLTLMGSSLFGSGNELNNVITGTPGDNELQGLAGNDTLAGGGGHDTLTGGLGDDVYETPDGDIILNEAANEGKDMVRSGGSYTLAANVENLILTGTGNINGTGNGLANKIYGNDGANKLTGGGGADTLFGGKGDDVLDGGTGPDELRGNEGNDTYINVRLFEGDAIVEGAGGGTDTVKTNQSFSLDGIANVENLTLTGEANLDGTGNGLNNVIAGNAGNNTLSGGDGNDTLAGGNGNDTLAGGSGADKMEGGAGDDLYIDPDFASGDAIVEAAGQGRDRVESAFSVSLAGVANVEDITLTGTDGVNATGNELDNFILGNAGANKLLGGGGNDTIAGGAGNDTMNGGAGADTFVFSAANAGVDRITGFQAGADRFDLSGGSFTNAVEVNGNTQLTHAGGKIVIEAVTGLSLSQWNALAGPGSAKMAGPAAGHGTAEQAALAGAAAYDGWDVSGAGHHQPVLATDFVAFSHIDFAFA